jgi:hypothetical protein
VPSRRLILAALGALPAQAWAQGQGQAQNEPPKDTVTPEAFLRGIYTPYPNQDFKGQPFWQVDRFFTPDLARAIEADMREAKRRGEVPRLDGDPFVDAQEWDIEDMHIAVRGTGADKARGTVSFKNFGKPIAILVDLAKLDEGWRIHDIRWDTKRTLRRLLGAR